MAHIFMEGEGARREGINGKAIDIVVRTKAFLVRLCKNTKRKGAKQWDVQE